MFMTIFKCILSPYHESNMRLILSESFPPDIPMFPVIVSKKIYTCLFFFLLIVAELNSDDRSAGTGFHMMLKPLECILRGMKTKQLNSQQFMGGLTEKKTQNSRVNNTHKCRFWFHED